MDSARAFYHGDAFKRSNTEVIIENNFSNLYLFGNWIARKNLKTGNININNCGYCTTTTKDRLNAVIYISRSAHDWDKIYQKAYEWYIIKHVEGLSSTRYTTTQHYPNGWFALVGDEEVIKKEYNPLKSALMITKFMDLLNDGDLKQSNDDQKRILNTVPALSFPDDWDSLPEVEKARRLEAVKRIGGEA